MSENLKYEKRVDHAETVTGRLMGMDATFELATNNDSLDLLVIVVAGDDETNAASTLRVNGKCLPVLIDALKEIQDIRASMRREDVY